MHARGGTRRTVIVSSRREQSSIPCAVRVILRWRI
jgi:hypothetical protein